jgi:chromosome partitioning protein
VGRVLAVISQKGGVGKTTTAINVAAGLARRGVKTLLIDADPQGSVRFGLGLFGSEYRVGLSDFLAETSELHEIVYPTMLPWLRAVLAGSVSDDGDHDSYQHRFASSSKVRTLIDRARERGYVIVIDTPPGLGLIAHSVLQISDNVLVPLQCEPLALQTTSQILRGVRQALASNSDLSFDGILLTMYEAENPASERVATFVRSQLPKELVFDIAIPRTDASIEAFAAGQPIVVRAPDDPAAKAYEALAELLASRLQ